MTYLDLLFFPAYLAFFYFVFSARRKKLEDPLLQHYHKRAFWVKALIVIPFALFNSKISPGDSYVLFQAEGYNIYKLILKDSSHIHWLLAPGSEYDMSGLLRDTNTGGYHSDEKNFMIVRITAIMSFFSFGRYLINCLFFSLISFTGVWKLFRFFYEQYPQLHRQLALAILYLPTFTFWCGGILKDPLCIGAMGWLTYATYEGFYKKKAMGKNLIIVIVASYVLVLLKVYILVAYLPFLIMYLILKNVNLIKNAFVKFALMLGIIGGVFLGGAKIMSVLQSTMAEFAGESITKNISQRQKGFADQASWAKSNFSLGVEFDGSVSSLVKMAPFAVIATLYRPFPWEVGGLSQLLTAAESAVMVFFTLWVLWKVGFANFFKSFKDPAILYCILFSILFALFVGATTTNFGTLSRYKIPCTPFYIIAIILIYAKHKKFKNQSVSLKATNL